MLQILPVAFDQLTKAFSFDLILFEIHPGYLFPATLRNSCQSFPGYVVFLHPQFAQGRPLLALQDDGLHSFIFDRVEVDVETLNGPVEVADQELAAVGADWKLVVDAHANVGDFWVIVGADEIFHFCFPLCEHLLVKELIIVQSPIGLQSRRLVIGFKIRNNQQKVQMLKILSGEEIQFDFASQSDLRLKGAISLRNDVPNHFIAFKLKSTNNSLFEADPYKGVLKPSQALSITVTTVGNVSEEEAREMALKNKFMLEYVSLATQPVSVQEALYRLKGHAVQHVKIFINTNKVRGLARSQPDPSVINSNRYSFHSLRGADQTKGRTTGAQQSSSDPIRKLEDELYFLTNQRTKLVKELSTPGEKKGRGFLKPLVVLILGVVAGNIGNKHLGVTDSIGSTLSSVWSGKEATVKEEEGFFSILNFGGDEVGASDKEQEQSEGWLNIF